MIMLSDTPAGNAAAVPVYEARALYQVPIDLVREDPYQPRKSFDAQDLEEMVASVAKHGIIQPVIFRRGPDGTVKWGQISNLSPLYCASTNSPRKSVTTAGVTERSPRTPSSPSPGRSRSGAWQWPTMPTRPSCRRGKQKGGQISNLSPETPTNPRPSST